MLRSVAQAQRKPDEGDVIRLELLMQVTIPTSCVPGSLGGDSLEVPVLLAPGTVQGRYFRIEGNCLMSQAPNDESFSSPRAFSTLAIESRSSSCWTMSSLTSSATVDADAGLTGAVPVRTLSTTTEDAFLSR